MANAIEKTSKTLMPRIISGVIVAVIVFYLLNWLQKRREKQNAIPASTGTGSPVAIVPNTTTPGTGITTGTTPAPTPAGTTPATTTGSGVIVTAPVGAGGTSVTASSGTTVGVSSGPSVGGIAVTSGGGGGIINIGGGGVLLNK